jgi:preprotein translocase subunit YajC
MESFPIQHFILLAQEPQLFDPVNLLPIGLIFIIAYFLLLRPAGREKAEKQTMIDKLKKNDQVETIGGILATVVRVKKEQGEVILRLDKKSGAEMVVNIRAISAVLGKKPGGNSKTESEESESNDTPKS